MQGGVLLPVSGNTYDVYTPKPERLSKAGVINKERLIGDLKAEVMALEKEKRLKDYELAKMM
jgi:hypothetical protein